MGEEKWWTLFNEKTVLRKCAFCGEEAMLHELEPGGMSRVKCGGCFLLTPWFGESAKAIAAWNRRHVDEEGVERVAKILCRGVTDPRVVDSARTTARRAIRAYLGLEGGEGE